MSKEKGLELARCAEINFDNLINGNPFLSKHPFVVIVKDQIKACIKELEEEDERTSNH